MDKIRDYHDKFYRPDNMVVFVTGMMDKKNLFGSFQPLEQEEQSKMRQALQKPFSVPCQPLGKEVTREVEYDGGKLLP